MCSLSVGFESRVPTSIAVISEVLYKREQGCQCLVCAMNEVKRGDVLERGESPFFLGFRIIVGTLMNLLRDLNMKYFSLLCSLFDSFKGSSEFIFILRI